MTDPPPPEIHRGDALDLLRSLEDDTVDAIITDPPYCSGAMAESHRTQARGQGLRSETLARDGWFKGDNMGTVGLAWLLRAVGTEAARVLKVSGSLLVFADWRMIPSIEPAIESAGLRWQNLIVWNKAAMGLGRGFRAQHELILHYTAGKPEYHNQATANVIQARRLTKAQKTHDTEKPLDLLRDLVRVTTPEGGLVVDPFCGSGSTLAAAWSLGRRAIGGDVDPKHIATASARFQPAPLFDQGTE